MNCLANSLLASIRAASALGPKQGNPSEAKVRKGNMLKLIDKAKEYKNKKTSKQS
jgi:hypothetical protein